MEIEKSGLARRTLLYQLTDWLETQTGNANLSLFFILVVGRLLVVASFFPLIRPKLRDDSPYPHSLNWGTHTQTRASSFFFSLLDAKGSLCANMEQMERQWVTETFGRIGKKYTKKKEKEGETREREREGKRKIYIYKKREDIESIPGYAWRLWSKSEFYQLLSWAPAQRIFMTFLINCCLYGKIDGQDSNWNYNIINRPWNVEW